MRGGRWIGLVFVACVSAVAPVRAHVPAAPAKAATSLLPEPDRKLYAEAFHEAERGRFDDARRRARRATDPLPAKILTWLELIEPGPGGDYAAAVAFLDGNPDWPGQAALQRRVELAMPADLPDAEILAHFSERPPITAAGAGRYAEALRRAGDQDGAAAVVRDAWVREDFPVRDERAFRKKFGEFLRREDHVARLDRLLWDHRARPAKRLARRLGPGYAALAEARLLLARRGPGVDAAIRRVPRALRSDPGLIYERARWRQRKGRYDDVIELLDPPDPQAPRAERWWRLRHWAVRQALARGDVSVAYRIAEGHGMAGGLGFAQAEWLAGWLALRFLNEPESAYRHFQRLHDGVSSPISRARAAYWAGQAARALDKRNPAGTWYAAARQWYAEAAAHDTAFYGQMAAQRLGRTIGFDATIDAAPDAEARAAFDAREIVRATRMLGELGEDKLQERFLARLAFLADGRRDYRLVAELAVEQGRTDLALRTARAARVEGIILPDLLFPSFALPEGERLEPAFLLAVIRQESGFYSDAVSHAGAHGLMQIMPRTAKRVARKIKVRYSREKLLSDPDYNLQLGRAYLADLSDRFDGSYVLALTAYNAGPARAKRWIRDFGDPRDPNVDPVDWIESIPFSETRNYVQRILEGLVVYRARLGHAQRPLFQTRDTSPLRPWAQHPADGDLSCCL